MIWPFKTLEREPARPVYYLTFRLLTGGVGKLQAQSEEELSRLLIDLRLAGAADITVVNGDGDLLVFDPGERQVSPF